MEPARDVQGDTKMTTTTATKITAAGYIAQDVGGYAIAAIGATAEEVRAEVIRECGPWEDRDGTTVDADHPEFGVDAKFVFLPATAALIAQVETDGGEIAWGVVHGIACTRDEEFGDDE